MYQIDLNSDLGESFGRYTIGNDDKIIPLITSANVACGYHASDPVVMMETIQRAKEAGIAVGAHPGLPDLMGFGRRSMAISNEEAKAYTLYQISAIGGMCKAAGVKLQHVKPHGALYNMAAKDYDLSKAICEAIYEYDKDLIVMGLSGSEMIKAAKDCGLKAASEVFADRAYEEDGTLVNRRKPGAMIEDEDEAIKRVIRMIKEGKVTSITGKDIDIKADSVCVHGDGEKALLFVEKIRKTFVENAKSKKTLRAENERLQEKIDVLKMQNRVLQQNQVELERLQDLFKLKQKYKKYHTVGARVISKGSGNWFDIFLINKGSKDGIKKDMNVIAGNGLVGIVYDVSSHTAKVRTIINDTSMVSAMFLKTNDACIVNGSLDTMEDGYLEVVYISKDAKVKNGDELVTSYVSSKFNEGITIGKVSDLKLDSTKLTKTAKVTPVVDFKHLKEVLVITDLKKTKNLDEETKE